MSAKSLPIILAVILLASPAAAQYDRYGDGDGGYGNSYGRYGSGRDSSYGDDSGTYYSPGYSPGYSGSSGSSSTGTGLPLNMQPTAFFRLIGLVVMLVVAALSWLVRQATSGGGAAVSDTGRAAVASMRESAAPTPVPLTRRHAALYSPTEIALASGRPLPDAPVNLPQGVHLVQHLKDKLRPKT